MLELNETMQLAAHDAKADKGLGRKTRERQRRLTATHSPSHETTDMNI